MIKKFNEYINEGKVPAILQKALSDLESEFGRLDVESEDSKEIEASIRDWGNWEHDYEDYERDEEDFEDDDFMILSDRSRKQAYDKIKKVEKANKKVKISMNTSEKNWIYFYIRKK